MLKKGNETNKLLFTTGMAWLFDAMDVGMLSFIIAALKSEWNLNETQMGWIGSVSSIGMAIGAILFGILADYFGRKDILIITLLLFSIATGFSAFTTSYALFLILRFFVGAGLGGELPVASTLVSESVPVKSRGKIVVLLESFWAGGWIIAAVISYFVIPSWGWRVALLISALPVFYALYLRYGLKENSIAQNKRIAKQSSLKENLLNLWSSQYYKTTIMLWTVWFMVVFSYYGMFLWLPSVVILKGYGLMHSFGYTLIMTLAQLPGYFAAAWLIEKWGRKWVLTIFLTGTAISALGFGSASTLFSLLFFGILLSFFNLGAWGALYAYSPEQYPTTMRASGTGIAAGIGRLGGILGPLMVGKMITKQYSFTFIFIIFCVAIMLAVLVIIILGKETKNTKLE
ncbi:MFS transporter [Liquorilactobacillus mali]|uniref:Major facilitator superfamily permease n=1 Tax=Liquorilactobacillus mali KCTC 3596 = DSM 20444 TaxID=1046596 RepID=J0URT8_9LACO|nr:MFS transporter [Liquorilactobacillus mali]EJE99330.1 major facilitator superfamily permease [Liquorilactobacillus mali KCTC 3596 = DSM 20444]KRN10416.1 major facilitator superfamily permease [Liquorilactobacillus mali KCTC 3596 = DSM 20444]MDC7952667.1 MFS transporter [Liquorilactobacillus mali]QFQ74642.1 MFS transporter [Liquorilactobacillus mali]